MEDRGRIIHYAIRIHNGAELLFLKASTYLRGKTRTNEKHLLAGTDFKIRFGNINNGSELHHILLLYIQLRLI